MVFFSSYYHKQCNYYGNTESPEENGVLGRAIHGRKISHDATRNGNIPANADSTGRSHSWTTTTDAITTELNGSVELHLLPNIPLLPWGDGTCWVGSPGRKGSRWWGSWVWEWFPPLHWLLLYLHLLLLLLHLPLQKDSCSLEILQDLSSVGWMVPLRLKASHPAQRQKNITIRLIRNRHINDWIMGRRYSVGLSCFFIKCISKD